VRRRRSRVRRLRRRSRVPSDQTPWCTRSRLLRRSRPDRTRHRVRSRAPNPRRAMYPARSDPFSVRRLRSPRMSIPAGIGAIDLMIAPPFREAKRTYTFLRANLRDRESLEDFEFPAQYMFKDVPHPEPGGDAVQFLLGQMDKFGIEKGMLGVSFREDRSADSPPALR